MKHCTRSPCPQWLEEHWEEWGAEYARRRADNPQYRFAWKQWKGLKTNHRLLPLLKAMTQDHCAYCDCSMETGTDQTIDHFKPKARFPKEAYRWQNLYLCCRQCQEKDDDHFRENLLRPDEEGYSFERYFTYKYQDGKIAVNLSADEDVQRRAQLTIDYLKLNKSPRPMHARR